MNRRGAAAAGLAATSVLLAFVTAFLGPSAAEPPLPARGWFPIFLRAHPGPWLVTSLLAASVVCGAAAVALALHALARGWRPRARSILGAGLVAAAMLVVVPPLGSADVLSYAAYGRMAALGHDPYATPPSSFAADRVIGAVEVPWRDMRSVYGPLATGEEAVIAHLAGDDLRLTVGLLDLVNGLAFAIAAVALHRAFRGNEARQRRAAVLVAANPLVLFTAVSGGHVDAIAVLFVVAALIALARRPWMSGALGGAAFAVKLSVALPVAGLAWAARRSRRAVAELAVAGGAVVAIAYGVVGLHATGPARTASRFVSIGTPWRWVRGSLSHAVDAHTAGTLVSLAAAVVIVTLALRLHRGTGWPVTTRTDDAAQVGLALAMAWTLAATYVLGWYDVLPWALLAFVPASRLDRILIGHTATLAIAYLPGRAVALPDALSTITQHVRSTVSPIVLAGLIVVAFVAGP